MTRIEKRSCKRSTSKTPIWLSYSNTEVAHEVLTTNYSQEGLCVKSKNYFRPGTPLLIKASYFVPQAGGARTFEGLPMIVHAEVKWCLEIPDPTTPSYMLGVKYFAPYY